MSVCSRISCWRVSIFFPPRKIQTPAAFSISENKINCLGQGEERLIVSVPNNDFVIVADDKRFVDTWWKTFPIKFYLVSLKDGSRTLLGDPYLNSISSSPNGTTLVYFNPYDTSYWSCNLTSGKLTSITKKISARLHSKANPDGLPGQFPYPFGIGGWVSENGILIYDEYDIWQVDVDGAKLPINLTNSYGQIHTYYISCCD